MHPHTTRRWRNRLIGVVSMATLVSGLGVAASAPAHAASTFILGANTPQPLIAGTSGDIVFSITNTGPDPTDNVVATFTLPTGVTYASDDESCNPAGQVVTCVVNVFSGLSVGQSASITLRVNVAARYVVDNGGGTNTANADVSVLVSHDGGAQSRTITAPVGERSDLEIIKYVNMPDPNAGDIVVYSIVVDNHGPSTARNVTIRDTLFRNFDPSGEAAAFSMQSCAFSVSQGGGAITQFTCTTGPVVGTQFGLEVGTFRTNLLDPVGLYDDGGGNLVLGGRLRASFRFVALEHTTVANEARVVADTTDPDTSNNLASVFSDVAAVSDLALTKTADVATANPDGTIVYTLTATNNGPSSAVNVVVTDTLPANVELVSATVPNGVCLAGTPGDLLDPVKCFLGTIPRENINGVPPIVSPPNSRVVTITVRVRDGVDLSVPVVNRAWVSSDVPDLNNSNNAAQAVTPLAEGNHLFNPVTPARELDTRDGTGGVPIGKVAAGGTIAFTVTGVNGIPVGAAAVSLNVTAEAPDADGHITVYPCASPRPLASNLNFVAGQTVANAVVAPVDPAGMVCFYSNVATNIISDVSGWFRAASGLTTMNPIREFDTRDGTGGVPVGPRAAGSILMFKVTGVNGVPAVGVDAVALNVTAANAGGDGFITAYPCGALPLTSNLNYVLGETVPNLVVAPVSPQGNVCFFTSMATELLADLSGWFATGSEYHAINPAREFDTRNGLGGVAVGKMAPGSTITFSVLGKHGVPLADVGAVILNVTAVNAAGLGYVTAYPCGSRPLTSNVNFDAGQPTPNAVIAPVSAWGTVCFYVNEETDLLVDISGWFSGPGV